MMKKLFGCALFFFLHVMVIGLAHANSPSTSSKGNVLQAMSNLKTNRRSTSKRTGAVEKKGVRSPDMQTESRQAERRLSITRQDSTSGTPKTKEPPVSFDISAHALKLFPGLIADSSQPGGRRLPEMHANSDDSSQGTCTVEFFLATKDEDKDGDKDGDSSEKVSSAQKPFRILEVQFEEYDEVMERQKLERQKLMEKMLLQDKRNELYDMSRRSPKSSPAQIAQAFYELDFYWLSYLSKQEKQFRLEDATARTPCELRRDCRVVGVHRKRGKTILPDQMHSYFRNEDMKFTLTHSQDGKEKLQWYGQMEELDDADNWYAIQRQFPGMPFPTSFKRAQSVQKGDNDKSLSSTKSLSTPVNTGALQFFKQTSV